MTYKNLINRLITILLTVAACMMIWNAIHNDHKGMSAKEAFAYIHEHSNTDF